jgi:hypothetical protein
VSLPLANGKYRKFGAVLVTILGSIAFAIWIFHFCLRYQYAATRPGRPVPSSGRLYALNTHGTIAYINKVSLTGQT